MVMVFARRTAATPLCPAGHLPHKGGDRIVAASLLYLSWAPLLLAMRKLLRESRATCDLPTCGGDARQGRGGHARHATKEVA
ncbi:hypothetical protein SAMN02982989_2473 [Xaviernesmea oryzae]|uniref:Lytic murein transglycosylase n=1 Tax=Xaviernesmea oryzae TaxID=464029 RepID=A0A1X7F9H0_9HYPH|nr:hypothetical protein SAMN02982989_2473 [Xaviernesmea oryzae]